VSHASIDHVDSAHVKPASSRLRTITVSALGVALICYLVTQVGIGAVLVAASSIGWGGFALLCVAVILVYVVLGVGWGILQPPSSGTRMLVFIWARMVREAASDVLPFSQIGGMALGLRAAILERVPLNLALATMTVDLATEFLAQIAYVAFSVLLIWESLPHTSLVADVVLGSSIWLLGALLAGAVFLALQRYGHRWVAGRLIGRLIPRSARYGAGVVSALDEIYGSPKRFISSLGIHLVGWFANAGCTWIAFRLIGVSVEPSSVVALEALVYATRAMGFFVPGALGVQEAAYTAFAQLFGIGGELALAVSLLKRARDLAVGVPVLLIWKTIEGRRAFAGGEAH
jgi:glycosyltransferase 2 family protein